MKNRWDGLTLVFAKFKSFNCIDCRYSLDLSVTCLQSFSHKLSRCLQFWPIFSINSSLTLSHSAICMALTYFNPLTQAIKPSVVICNCLSDHLLSNIRSSCRYLHRSPIHFSIGSVTIGERNMSCVTFGVSNRINVNSLVKPIDKVIFNWMRSVLMVDGNCDRSQLSQLHSSMLRAITLMHLQMRGEWAREKERRKDAKQNEWDKPH